MGLGTWKQKVYRVLAIDTDKDIRQKLIDYYCKNLKYRYAPNDRSMVYRAKDISDAQKKIGRGLDLHLIVFSQNFPELKREQLREWLSSAQMATPFIMVPLGSPAKAT